ncbi:hypothetical protein HG531_003163 [Fusarium graminearum]|nr:hypothetical protein HG531_003163 [Fusarium graminearum]
MISAKTANKALSASKKSPLVTLRSNKLERHASTLGNLSNNVLVENSLNKNKNGAVLALNTKFLGLDINVDRLNLVDATLLLSLGLDPVTKFIVDSGTALTIFIVIIANVELRLKLARERSLAGLDSFLTHVDSPFMLLDFVLLSSCSGLGLDLLELIITASILVGVLAKVDIADLTASLAVEGNVVILDHNIGLGVLALFAENKLVDEAIEVILELGGIVGTVDDPTVVLGVNVGLSTKFETEVLDDVGAGTGE